MSEVDVATAMLSRRQREVLALMSQGLGVRAIGAKLEMSYGTARVHVNEILGKFGAHSQLEVVAHLLKECLERAEKDRQHLREKNDIIRAYAGPGGMSPEDVAAALERAERVRKVIPRVLLALRADGSDPEADALEAAANG